MNLLIEQCEMSAKKYNNVNQWRELDFASYMLAKSNTLLIPSCAHMKVSNKWNEDTCIESAQPFNSQTNWKRKSYGAFNMALTLNVVDKCCAHMTGRVKWNFDACIKEACKFTSPSAWQIGSPSSYQAALSKNKTEGWKDKCILAMNIPAKVEPSHDDCLRSASQYPSPSEWKKCDRSIFNKARKDVELYMACIAHMKNARIPTEYWIDLRCIAAAKKYKTRKEWKTKSLQSFGVAKKKPELMAKCVSHMKYSSTASLNS